jgi:hypothetical protein
MRAMMEDKTNSVQFADLIGQQILVLIPKINTTLYQKVKLHGVEAGGLWLESQDVTNALLQTLGAPATEKTVVFFWPYHQILFAISSIDQPSFDERALGL